LDYWTIIRVRKYKFQFNLSGVNVADVRDAKEERRLAFAYKIK